MNRLTHSPCPPPPIHKACNLSCSLCICFTINVKTSPTWQASQRWEASRIIKCWVLLHPRCYWIQPSCCFCPCLQHQQDSSVPIAQRHTLSVPRGGESETQTSEQTCPKHYNQSVERSQLVFGLCLHAPFSGQRSRNKCLGIFFLLFNQVQSLESNLSLDLSLSSLCPTLGIILVSAFLGKEYNLKVAGW